MTGRGASQAQKIRRVQAARPGAKREHAERMRKRLSTPERISGYTDAVFAVVITITVLELHPPESARIGALLRLWPTAVSYVVSYVFVAIIWINHHFLMGYLRQTSLRVIWLNFLHLFFVSLLPFATAWIADTELARGPVVVYSALFVVTDAAYNLFEREVLRDSSEFTPAEYRATRQRSLTALALFIVATLLALLQPVAGMGFIALALLLHLRPDVARSVRATIRRQRKPAPESRRGRTASATAGGSAASRPGGGGLRSGREDE